jgi:hypothetical protein
MTEDIRREPYIEDDDIIQQLTKTIVDLQKRVSQLEAAPADDLEIKTTTGDFAVGDSWDGRRVLNTFDNNYKIFADGGWRQIVAY